MQRAAEVQRAEAHRRGDAERSRELSAVLGNLAPGCVRLLHDAPRALEEGIAFHGDAELAGGPLDEMRAERALELFEALAHDGLGEVELAPRAAYRSRLRDGQESRNSLELHCSMIPNT